MDTIRIGLMWHSFGRPNLGVDALCRADIDILRRAAAEVGLRAEFVVIGMRDSAVPEDEDVSLAPYIRVRQLLTGRLGDYRRMLADCDLIVDIGAGDGFSDIYGVYFFLMHAMTKHLSIRSGRPLIMAPQTLGPFRRRWARALAARILRRARCVFARDHLSMLALSDMRADAAAVEVVDVAFALPCEPSPKSSSGLLRVGFNVSGLLFNHADRFGLSLDYPLFCRQAIESLGAIGAEVWLVPHVIHDDANDEDDWPVIQSLAREFAFVHVAPRFASAIEAKSFISGLDLFSGARMHACIGAFSSGVPVVPVAYSRKFAGLFGVLGYEHLIDGAKETTEQAVRHLLESVERRGQMQEAIARGMVEARRRLAAYQSRLQDLIREAAAAKSSAAGRAGHE